MSSEANSIAWVTVPSREVAEQIATSLLNDKLVACVNIIPGVKSMYWWDGKVQSDQELILMIKTRTSLTSELITAVKSKHPYDTPEVICVPIAEGNTDYLKWITDSTKNPQ
jgi:periplasmic divalent cation tolerance protein